MRLLVFLVVGIKAFDNSTCNFEENNERLLLRESSLDPADLGRWVRVRGHWPNLPGSNSSSMPIAISPPVSSRFPLVMEATRNDQSITKFGIEARRALDRELSKCGAVLFRGLPVKSGEQFSEFVQALGYEPITLAGGGTARSQVAKYVRTASDEPHSHVIEPHQDMAHNPQHPLKLAFFMIQAPPADQPDAGGETILTNIRDLTEQMHRQGIIDEFEQKGGVLYQKTLWDLRQNPETSFSWQQRFFADNISQVEVTLRNLPKTIWHWDYKKNTLHYEHVLPATRPHYQTQESIFFNGIHTNHRDYFDLAPHIDTTLGSPYDTAFGNGSPIPTNLLDQIRGAWWQNSIALSLQPGDIAIVDNYLTGHGRMPWKPHVQRKMLISHLVS